MNMIAEIRGMHFRLSDPKNPAPAKLLIEVLATGTELNLVREPENEYDKNAIQVWLPFAALEEELLQASPDGEPSARAVEFEAKLNGYGWTLQQLRDSPELMLGYVGKEWAEVLAPLMDAEEGRVASASFCVSGKGKPQVRVELSG